MMKWIYNAMTRPIMLYACVSWAGSLNKKYLVRKLTKVQRLACLLIPSAFLGTPTGALDILLYITPIWEFLLAESVRGSYRITVSGLWHGNPIGSFGKTKSYVDVCNEARSLLPLLQMPADRIKKTVVFESNFEYQIMDKKNAISRFESVLNQNTVKVFTDGLKLDGRVGASFSAEYPNNSQKQSFFHFGIYSTVFQAMAWYGMEWKMEWNGNFGTEYGRCQNGMEDFKKGRQSSILSYQFHTRFRGLYLQKNKHGYRVVTNNIVTEVFKLNIYGIICRQIVVVWLCIFIAQMVYCIAL